MAIGFWLLFALLNVRPAALSTLNPPPVSLPAQAQAVTLTVAQAFKVALDLWEVAQEGERIE